MRIFSLLIMYLALVPPPAFARESRPFPNIRFLVSEGMQIHIREWKAQTECKGRILFIHGFCGSTWSWQKAADILSSRGYDCIAIDLPGFGYSARPQEWDHSASHRAGLCRDILQQVDSSQAKWIICGHSMGASVAAAMANLFPERCAKLVLVDGNFPQGEVKGSPFMRMFGRFQPIRWIMGATAHAFMFHPKPIRKMLRSAYACEPSDEDVQGYLSPLKIRGTVNNIMDMMASFYTETWPMYSDLKMPVSIIWGEKDSVIPFATGKAFAGNFPDAKITFIPGAGHCPMETHCELFLEGI